VRREIIKCDLGISAIPTFLAYTETLLQIGPVVLVNTIYQKPASELFYPILTRQKLLRSAWATSQAVPASKMFMTVSEDWF